MIVRLLKLNNIRSYREASIEFPLGSFLLSGDIGAGKTTVLMAIEFALFGLLRGSINGTDLLRHGTNDGSVSLSFELNEKKYTVFRRLKRTATGITQDSGFLEIDGVKENLVHTELKARILELLGYPKTLISKSKGLIFRYTTYTPQEEVKKIMYESPDARLDTLRKVFGLDKYKTAKENVTLIVREIKQNEAVLASKIEDEDLLLEELSIIEVSFKKKQEDMQMITLSLEKSVQELKSLKNQLEEMKKEKEETEKLKQEKQIYAVKIEQLSKNLTDLERRNKEYSIGEKPLLINADDYETRLSSLLEKQNDTQEKISEAKTKIARIEASKDLLKKNNSIESLKICPTCKQEVTEEHKHKIIAESSKEISEYALKEEKLNDYLQKAGNNLKIINEKITECREKINAARLSEQAYKNYQEKLAWKQESQAEQQRLKNEIQSLKDKEEAVVIPKFDFDSYRHLEEKIEEAAEKERELMIAKTSINKDLESSQENKARINKRIEEIKLLKKEIKSLRTRRNWLQEYFTNTLSNIEKNLMLSIHNEFNSSFQEWFETLISDETITSRLDDTFTPYIIQNGQTTTFENLSGGEKTSLSLAYRLALNKVINDFISTINAKDLIILDEPTDGFSTTQLDKIRDVLEKIPAKQVMIVSHEPKLESFVEEIIRVHKTGHISHAS